MFESFPLEVLILASQKSLSIGRKIKTISSTWTTLFLSDIEKTLGIFLLSGPVFQRWGFLSKADSLGILKGFKLSDFVVEGLFRMNFLQIYTEKFFPQKGERLKRIHRIQKTSFSITVNEKKWDLAYTNYDRISTLTKKNKDSNNKNNSFGKLRWSLTLQIDLIWILSSLSFFFFE